MPSALLLGRVVEGAKERLRFAAEPFGALRSTERLLAVPRRLRALAGAALDTARPAPEAEQLNLPLSSERHLGIVKRPLDELRQVKRAFGTTVNDVLLASVAGALRRYAIDHGRQPGPLKTMVPVNVRAEGEDGGPGNRISFMFVDLPCEEPDRVRRLRELSGETSARKDEGLPRASETMLEAIAQIPHAARGVVSRLVATPRVFNLTVSNIPGPPLPAYMCGCLLESAYPVVPLPERHSLSIGMTTIRDQACFGLYADRRSIPDVEAIGAALDRELDELLAEAADVDSDPVAWSLSV